MNKIKYLLINEIKKVSVKLLILCLFIIYFAVVFLGYSIKNQPNYINMDKWEGQLSTQNESYFSDLENTYSYFDPDNFSIINKIKINEYRLENKIPPVLNHSLSNMITSIPQISTLIFILVAIVSLLIINENKDQKLYLLTLPAKRWKILLSKYLASIFFSSIFLITIFIFSILVGFYIFGPDQHSAVYIYHLNGRFIAVGTVLHCSIIYLSIFIKIIFTISTLFLFYIIIKNIIMVIILSVIFIFFNNTLALLLNRLSFNKFLPFANIDFLQYFSGIPIIKGNSIGFSFIIFVLYLCCFSIITYYIYNKSDII